MTYLTGVQYRDPPHASFFDQKKGYIFLEFLVKETHLGTISGICTEHFKL